MSTLGTFEMAAFMSQALDRVSDDIKREVGALVEPAAQAMVAKLESSYPYDTRHPNAQAPHMRDDIYIRREIGREALLPKMRVVGPRLAYIWQDGTVERGDPTRPNPTTGLPAKRGRMPAADRGFFKRVAAAIRWDMYTRQTQILDRARAIE